MLKTKVSNSQKTTRFVFKKAVAVVTKLKFICKLEHSMVTGIICVARTSVSASVRGQLGTGSG